MKSALLLIALCLISTSLGNPSDNALLIRQRREIDFIGNTRLLIEELLQNLRNASQQGFDAVKTFTLGIQDQGKLFGEKLSKDIQNIRDRVQGAIKNFTDRFINAGSAVRDCIESHRTDSEKLFDETVEKSKVCAGDRIKEIGDMIQNLRELSNNATDYVSNAVSELKQCTENGQGLLATGTCLGGIAVRTEFKGAIFLTQSGLLISRINLGLTTLPAALEVCAGTRLVEVGVNSAKLIMEVGSCSASSVYSSLTGNAAA